MECRPPLLAPVIDALDLIFLVSAPAYEVALHRLERTGTRADTRRAKQFRECVAREKQALYLHVGFLNCVQQLSTAGPPAPRDVEIYNSVAVAVQKSRWPIETKVRLIQAAKRGIRYEGWLICLHCGMLVTVVDAYGQYCSKVCWKRMVNRRAWQSRKSTGCRDHR
jgi:hypothetical protein